MPPILVEIAPKPTSPRRAGRAGLLLAAGLLGACQAAPDTQLEAWFPAPAPLPGETELAALTALLLEGELRGQQGDAAGAYERYYRASLSTPDPQVAHRATEIALWLEDFERALPAARRWRALLPDDPRPRRALGSIHAARGDVPAAVAAYREALARAPAPDWGALAGSLSLPAAAAARPAVLRELAAAYPEHAGAHYQHARAARAADDPATALAAARAALRLRPDWPAAVRLEAEMLRELDRVPEAVERLRAALAAQPPPGDWRLRQELAEVLLQAGESAAARAEYARLVARDTAQPRWRMALGTLALLAEDWPAAEAQFEALSLARPLAQGQPPGLNRAVAAYFLGLIAEERGDVEAALGHYHEVDERDYLGGDRYYQKARGRTAQLLLARDPEAARRHLAVSRARSERPENVAHFYAAEADLLYGLRRYAEGMALLDRAVAAFPDSIPLRYTRALTAERLGRTELLERDLGVVLELRPDHPQALNALGYTWADHNRNLEQALDYIERAHAQLPDNAAIIDSLGWAHYRLGNLQRAEDFLRRAHAMQPDGEVVAHLVEVLWVRGRRAEARRLYREALERLREDEFLDRVAARFAL